jgi:CheY-like chemotaxis protein
VLEVVAVPTSPPHPKPPLSSSGSRPRAGRLLIIDDEPLLGDMLAGTLSDHCQVEVVTTAVAALARLYGGRQYDVVLCDLMMPAMDGIEFHRILSVKMPQEADRIVFMTGGAYTARTDAFVRRVHNVVLDKPVDLDMLLALIEYRIRIPTSATAGHAMGSRR